MTEWIKCSERMPPEGESVLIYNNGDYEVAYLNWREKNWLDSTPLNVWQCGENETPIYEVFHWMPLPEEPKE